MTRKRRLKRGISGRTRLFVVGCCWLVAAGLATVTLALANKAESRGRRRSSSARASAPDAGAPPVPQLPGARTVGILDPLPFAELVDSGPASPPEDRQELLREIAAAREQTRQCLSDARVLFQRAKGAKDILRANCLADKVHQLESLARALNGAHDNVSTAAKLAPSALQSGLGLAARGHRMALMLRSEAQVCSGEDLTQLETTTTGVTAVDPSIPGSPVPIIERPPAASPAE